MYSICVWKANWIELNTEWVESDACRKRGEPEVGGGGGEGEEMTGGGHLVLKKYLKTWQGTNIAFQIQQKKRNLKDVFEKKSSEEKHLMQVVDEVEVVKFD